MSGMSSRCSRTYVACSASRSSHRRCSRHQPSTRRLGAPQRLEHQVVAAHPVEHHHVERCGRGALLGEPAHVEPARVGCDRASAGAPRAGSRGRRRPRRCRAVKKPSNWLSVNPCGWSSWGSNAIRSTTLTTRTRRYGTCSRSNSRRGQDLLGRYVARRREHDVRARSPAAASVPAHSQIPAPAAQWRCASVERQVLQVRLLVDHDQVDVVGLRRQWSAIDSVVFASGGSHTRTTSGASGMHGVDHARALVARSRCGRCASRSWSAARSATPPAPARAASARAAATSCAGPASTPLTIANAS